MSLIPQIQEIASESSNMKEIMWQLLYFSKSIPFSLANILKEYFFRNFTLNILFLGFWEQVMTLPLGIPLAFLYFPLVGIPASEIPNNFRAAVLCIGGINTFTADKCETAYLDIILFCLSSSFWGITCIAVVRHGSANLL